MKKIYLSVVMLMFSLSVQAGPETFANLNAQLQSLNKATGSFAQRAYDVTGLPKQNAHGTFKLAKPNQFVWHYQSPFEQQLISDGKVLWVWDVDLDQASKQPLTDYVSHTPLSMLLKDDLSKNFTYVSDRTDVSNIVWVGLKPKNDTGDFKKIEIGLLNGKLIGMELTDRLNQNIQIDLLNLRNDNDINQSTFAFTPPQGVDVIER